MTYEEAVELLESGQLSREDFERVKQRRNAAICEAYVNGVSVHALSEEYGISTQRIRQILRRNGVTKRDQFQAPRRHHLGMSQVGITVTDSVKEKLKQEAQRRGMTMSSFGAELLKESLDALRVA